jgi:3-deoxy-D-manno-octulosonic acid kinase
MFQTRSRLEFNILADARSVGINAPEPLAYIERGEFLYQAWLITRQIEGGMNLIEYSKTYPSMTSVALSALADELRKLINQKIHHVDLHPGNVVIIGDATSVKSAWIVDFDKAYKYSGNKNVLRDKYLRRWRRAVIKHRLPEVYCEVISLALREHF